jgi:hypothetical protein
MPSLKKTKKSHKKSPRTKKSHKKNPRTVKIGGKEFIIGEKKMKGGKVVRH